jgi:Zn finger protein HypA/HybF involved in hydrogenase expression
MSIIQTVKSTIGLGADRPSYECVDCGNSFETSTEPGSHWFSCPECGSDAPLEADADDEGRLSEPPAK